MTNQIAPAEQVAAANISQRILEFTHQIGSWIAGNIGGILIAVAIGTVVALILIGVRSLGARMIRHGAEHLHWRVIFARAIARTNLPFIILCSAELVAEHANTPAALLRLINLLFVIAAAFQAAIWARELVIGFVEHRVGAEADNSALGSATGIIRLLVSVALFAIAIIVILDNLGVNVTGLVAGLGIGGIAIGLAAQGIFSDLFAALSIIFDKPFRRGDNIQFDTASGTVEQIGLKTTRLRSASGEQVIVSNANLLNKQLHNFASQKHRRVVLLFSLAQSNPPELCARVPELVSGVVAERKSAKLIHCGMIGFGPSSFDFELAFEVRGNDGEIAFAKRSEVALAIMAKFAEAGIDLAMPAQVAFTAAPDGHLVMPYPDETCGPEPEGDGSGPLPAAARNLSSAG